MGMARRDKRRNFTGPQKFDLINDDLDAGDLKFEKMQKEMRGTFASLRTEIRVTTGLVVTVLIAVIGANFWGP